MSTKLAPRRNIIKEIFEEIVQTWEASPLRARSAFMTIVRLRTLKRERTEREKQIDVTHRLRSRRKSMFSKSRNKAFSQFKKLKLSYGDFEGFYTASSQEEREAVLTAAKCKTKEIARIFQLTHDCILMEQLSGLRMYVKL